MNMKSSWEEFTADNWRSPMPTGKQQSVVGHRLDVEYDSLTDNDVWFYQLQLERFITRNMGGVRHLEILACICAQARRKYDATR